MYRSSTIGRRGGRMLVLIALFELVLAAGFWLILGSLPEAGGAMQATAAILGGVGVVMLLAGLLWMRSAAKKDRISSTGVAGTGQIMGLGQTGMTVNDQPQVELDLLVTIPGRSPYRVKVKEIVPLIMLNRLQGTLPVRVDPAEPNAVVIQWDQPNTGSATLGGFDLAEIARSGTVLYGGGLGGTAGGQPGLGAAAGHRGRRDPGPGRGGAGGRGRRRRRAGLRPGRPGRLLDRAAARIPPHERHRGHRANRPPRRQRPDRGRRAPVHDDHDRDDPRPGPVRQRALGGHGPPREGRSGRGRRRPSRAGRARQPGHGHVRVGPHLTSRTGRPGVLEQAAARADPCRSIPPERSACARKRDRRAH